MTLWHDDIKRVMTIFVENNFDNWYFEMWDMTFNLMTIFVENNFDNWFFEMFKSLTGLDHSSPASSTPARQCHPSSHSPSQLWSSNYQTSALNPAVSTSLSASPAPASDQLNKSGQVLFAFIESFFVIKTLNLWVSLHVHASQQ